MPAVFISYSSRNDEKAKAVVNMLERFGIYCWYAQRDIPPGGNYTVEIPKAIQECRYFVLLLSNDAQDSPYVRLELDQAIKRGKEVLPIQLEPMDQNDGTNFLINAKQMVDGSKDLNAAVDAIIIKIRTDRQEPRDIPVRQMVRPFVHREPVQCPHCGCTVLKKQWWTLTDLYIDPEREMSYLDMIQLWINNNKATLLSLVQIGAFVAGIATVILACMVESGTKRYIVAGIILLYLLLMFVFSGIRLEEEDIPYTLLRAIRNAKMKYHTFKCAKCEKIFSTLLPEDDILKERIPDLIEDPEDN